MEPFQADAGHRETQTRLPDPLGPTGFWNVGTLALPAAVLSGASAMVFVVVWAFLQFSGGRERDLFVLPFPAGLGISGLAAGLAWWIAYQCQRRPGRIFPRLWVLGLAGMNFVIVVLTAFFPDQAWSLALAVAGLAAALTLIPRLRTLRPDSSFLQKIAPLTVLLVLVLCLPTSCVLRTFVASETERRVDRHIQQLRLWTTEVQAVSDYPWKLLEENPERAAQQIERLKKLDFKGAVEDEELWRSAAHLGKSDQLAAAIEKLTDTVVAGLDPDRAPKISSLSEPALRWDQPSKRWQEYSQFGTLSGIVGSYYQEMGRLFAELSPAGTAENVKLVDLQVRYEAKKKELAGHLGRTAGSWVDNWAAFVVPGHEELVGRQKAPLSEVLQAPFGGSFRPADLERLTSLPLSEVKVLARGAAGCGAPSYEEGDREYFRLDCYSYLPQKEGPGAELRIEMRLVYQSESGQPLLDSEWPVEVYFLFPIPADTEPDAFREEVMTEFAAAVRARSSGIVRSSDRGGSVAGGFRIQETGSSVRVYRPNVVPLIKEQKALEVRAERWPSARKNSLTAR